MATSSKAKKKTVRIASGRKRARQDVKLNAANTALRSQFRTVIKNVQKAVTAGDKAKATDVFKVHQGRPNCIDLIVNGDVQLLINTPLGKHAQHDDYTLRQAAIANRVSYTTTLSAASAALDAILALRSRRPTIRSLQEWHHDLATWRAEGGDRDAASRATPVSATAVR